MFKRLMCLLFVSCLVFTCLGCGSDKKASEQPPVKKEKQQIEINITAGSFNNGKVPVDVSTNIIDGAELMVTLENDFIWREEHGIDANKELNEEQFKQSLAETYRGSGKKTVQNGKVHCEFSGDKLEPGTYDITVSMSIPKLQKDKKVPALYGDNGENLADGPCVRAGTSGGKSISKTVRVEIH